MGVLNFIPVRWQVNSKLAIICPDFDDVRLKTNSPLLSKKRVVHLRTADKAHHRKMLVHGKRFRDPQLSHDGESCAVGVRQAFDFVIRFKDFPGFCFDLRVNRNQFQRAALHRLLNIVAEPNSLLSRGAAAQQRISLIQNKVRGHQSVT